MKSRTLVFLLSVSILFGCNTHSTYQIDYGLPSLYVTIAEDALDSIMHNKHYKADAFVTLVSVNGDTLICDSIDNIHTRGNNTFLANKKAFTVKLRKKTKVLGLDRGKRYVLLANASDESHIRNAIAFDLAMEMGLKAPKYVFLSLYINSKYCGLYQMTNKVEDVLDINRDGYLIEGNSNVELPRHLIDIERDSILRSYNLIESYIENCSENDACYDSVQKWVDLVSFAKYYLLNEITLNTDAPGPGSFFKYVSNEDGGQLHAGPVWDYDKSFATIHRGRNYEWEKNEIMACAGIMDSMGCVRPGMLLHCLWKREEFRVLVKNIYNDEVSAICHAYIESGKVDSLIENLRIEAEKDYEVNPGWRYFAYDVETQRAKSFLQQRIEFMDWFFSTSRKDMVCVTYIDTCMREKGRVNDKVAQIWLPSNRTISVPKLTEIAYNYTPIPEALCYKGTDSIVSNHTIIKSDDEIELKWRKPSKKEVLFRRFRKKIHSLGL